MSSSSPRTGYKNCSHVEIIIQRLFVLPVARYPARWTKHAHQQMEQSGSTGPSIYPYIEKTEPQIHARTQPWTCPQFNRALLYAQQTLYPRIAQNVRIWSFHLKIPLTPNQKWEYIFLGSPSLSSPYSKALLSSTSISWSLNNNILFSLLCQGRKSLKISLNLSGCSYIGYAANADGMRSTPTPNQYWEPEIPQQTGTARRGFS